MISWTFDPLLSQNANFNLNRLGVQCCTYHVDFYGAMPNDLSRGLPSDRLEADWYLDDSLKAPVPPLPDDISAMPFLLKATDGQPRQQPVQMLNAMTCCVEIPQDFLNLKKSDIQLAQHWQQMLCQTLQQAFQRGYMAVAFRRTTDRHVYILTFVN
jgi:predicted GNAT superfamily acetyltransferase